MPKAEYYRGKPANFERIADRRLWRYVTTDHASGCLEVFYVLGAESSANLLSALIDAMTHKRQRHHAWHPALPDDGPRQRGHRRHRAQLPWPHAASS